MSNETTKTRTRGAVTVERHGCCKSATVRVAYEGETIAEGSPDQVTAWLTKVAEKNVGRIKTRRDEIARLREESADYRWAVSIIRGEG